MLKKQSGFSTVLTIIILTSVIEIAAVSYYVYWKNKKPPTKTATTTQQSTATPAQSNLKVAEQPYIDPATKLEIYHPEGWIAAESNEQFAIAEITPPPGSQAFKDFAYIFVYLMENTESLPLDKYVEGYKQSLASQSKNYKDISDTAGKLKDGSPVRIVVSSYDINGSNVTTMNMIAVEGSLVGVQRSVANTSAWNSYKAVFEEASLK